MSTPLPSDPGTPSRERRLSPVVWGASALGAVILVLGVSGTLSSWTTAIITNDTNTVASTDAVSLKESSGIYTCDTTNDVDNVATCSTINKYGGDLLPLDPDGDNTVSVTVNLENTGTGTGDLTLSPDVCTSTPVTGSTGADPVTYPLCNEIEVTLSCTGGIAAPYTFGPVVLSDPTYVGEVLPIGSLDATEATDCTFDLELPDGTPAGYASQVASQQLVWTLTAAP